MRKGLSARLDSIEDSPTCRIDGLAKEMKSRGDTVINLCAGEPDLATPEFVARAGEKAIAEGKTKYTPVAGDLGLRQAIVKNLARAGVAYDFDQIVVSNGAKQILYSLGQVLIDPGDEVIVVAPYWVSYVEQIELAGGKPVVVRTREDFSLDIEAVAQAVTERTVAVIINSPNNPTGAVYSRESLVELGRLAQKRDFWLISDEVYGRLVYDVDFVSMISLEDSVRERVLLVDGLSKSMAMTGWRVGYLAGDAEVVAGVIKLQSQLSSGASSISQEAARVALADGGKKEIDEMVRIFNNRRQLVGGGLADIGLAPKTWPAGAFYFFFPIGSTKILSEEFCERLLVEQRVALVPGTAFGQEGYVRLSYAASEEDLREGLKRIKNFTASL